MCPVQILAIVSALRENPLVTSKEPISITHPELAKEAFGWDPQSLTFGSHSKKPWLCKYGHVWVASVDKRSIGRGCPVCAGKKVLEGFNDLASSDPVLANEAFEWDSKTVTAGSHSKMGWQCNLGHTWIATIKNRANGAGCPVCAGRKVLVGFNDLAFLRPDLASDCDGWDPTTVTRNSGEKKEWKCQFGHTYNAIVNDRTNGHGCPVCSGRAVLQGFNDLGTTRPDLAVQAFNWDPTSVTPYSGKKKDWICGIGHRWKAVVSSRTSGNGCPICAGKQVLQGFNDLATINPQLAVEASGWDPTTVTRNSNQKKSWECVLGHRWISTVNDRADGRGCPTCATSGFDPNHESWLYFLHHPKWEMYQIGITNFPNNRLHSHNILGWEVLELRGPMDGHLTRKWETAILRMLRAKGADLSNRNISGKFDGYSEAWSIQSFNVGSIIELMRLTEEFEENRLTR